VKYESWAGIVVRRAIGPNDRTTRPRDLVWSRILGVSRSPDSWSARRFFDARRSPRFKLGTDIRVYTKQGVVRGHTVDISQSGIAAMLMDEIPLHEIVRLEFSLATGEVEVMAVVRQRSAFRYGFQFVEGGPARSLINRTCRDLGMEQSLRDSSS
jgi:hypothetical protein